NGADRALDIALTEIMALHSLRIQRFQYSPRGIAAIARARDGDVIAARIDHDAEPPLDLGEVLPIGSDQRGGCAVVVEVDDDLRLGGHLQVAFEFAAGSERR